MLLAKSEVKNVLQRFCAYAEKQFSQVVKVVRSDNGMEFMCLRKYFQDNRILHQTSCVNTPQQNGRVKRKHIHILNVARALLFQSKMPVKFWGKAITTETHVINMTPTKILQGISPYEVLFGVKPSYSSLRVFGSLCHVHRRDRDKDKFGERSTRCAFVGYPFGKKAWRVYDLDNNVFLVSRDISFVENVFPFAQGTESKVEIRELTGGSGDDWIIDIVEKDGGSVASTNEVGTGGTENIPAEPT